MATLLGIWSFLHGHLLGRVSAFQADGSRIEPQLVWRVSEAAEGVPIGAEYILQGDELFAGHRGVGKTPSGKPLHIELVHDEGLEDFLLRRLPAARLNVGLGNHLGPDLCSSGRFLLNDPRVGLLNNQRLSYETAMNVARLVDRILVMPGFFKFPHPDAYDGIQWVRVRSLFNWTAVEECYAPVIELAELVGRCGPDVLDNHITVPFVGHQTIDSTKKAPWFNGTRHQLSWALSDGGEVFRFRPRETRAETPLRLTENMWRLLHPFLAAGAAEAQTLRAHGLIAKNTTLGYEQVCFFPSPQIFELAERSVGVMQLDVQEPVRLLAVHLRLFKRSANSSGGFIPETHIEITEFFCNLEPELFHLIVPHVLLRTFKNFMPTHTYLATNEGDPEKLGEYTYGFPGARHNPFSPARHDAAVSHEDCEQALMSVIVDATMCAMAQVFVGNMCSTMSQYIHFLRLALGRPYNSSFMLGGAQHHGLLTHYRTMLREDREAAEAETQRQAAPAEANDAPA